MDKLTAIDLFAGGGGLSLGLHHVGIATLFMVEKDPMAFETLQANFSATGPYPALLNWPSWLEQAPHDIEKLLSDEQVCAHLTNLRGKVDLICGGPPCQGFSVGGIRDGNDKRNQLPLRYLEFVHLVQPRAIILENVEGMTRKFVSKPGDKPSSFSDWIVSRLTDDGYDVASEIVDASQFGVPQVRRRLIIFGVRREELVPGVNALDFFKQLRVLAPTFAKSKGLAPGAPVTVWDAIHDLDGAGRVTCPDSPKFQAGTYTEANSPYASLMRRGIPTSQIPDSHRFSNHGSDTLAFYQKVQSTQPHGRLPKSFLLECGTKKDKKVFIDPAAPASTITTHPDEFIHYAHPRNITVREMARLQSFPDDFHFKGRYTINGPRRRFDVARCSQVGNAVPPLLAEALGIILKRFLHDGDRLIGKQEPASNGVNWIQAQLPIAPAPATERVLETPIKCSSKNLPSMTTTV